MKHLKFVAVLGLFALSGVGAWFWWQFQTLHPSTNDAYVQANIVTIAPLVGGRVLQVAVAENKQVKAGDLLFEIDPASYQAALDAAQAQLALAQQSSGAQNANVNAARARLDGAQAVLAEARNTHRRNQVLFSKGDVARATLESSQATLDEAVAALASSEADVQAAKATSGEPGNTSASVRAAQATLILAQLDLEHSRVVAPASGWIANLSLRPGSSVVPHQPLFSLVEDSSWWIDANFKETDLQRLRPGMPATISLDMYPGVTLEGEVQSLGAGSGAVFSLLPPENASGNWVKVTQRFTARIALNSQPTDAATPLRVGASTTVTIDTTMLDMQ